MITPPPPAPDSLAPSAPAPRATATIRSSVGVETPNALRSPCAVSISVPKLSQSPASRASRPARTTSPASWNRRP